MKTNIVYVVVGIAVVGIGGYAMLGMGGKDVAQTNTNSPTVSVKTGTDTAVTVESGTNNSSNILAEYMKTRLGNITCTLHMEEQGGVVDQVVYISGEKMRMDATVKHEGGTFETHMVNDGEYTYMWGIGGSFKMKNDLADNMEDDEETESNTGKFGEENDLEAILEKMPENDCKKWKVDTSKFELPEGTEFQEFTGGFQLDNVKEIQAEQVEDLENNPYENMPDLEKITDMIPKEYRDNKYMEQMGDKFPSESGL